MFYSENPDGTMAELRFAKGDMNWVQGEAHAWAECVCPAGITATVSRYSTEKGTLRELYTFSNHTKKRIPIQKGEAGIWAPLPDRYDSAAVCHRERCHAHLWCGGTSSWINALRMSAQPPHLGLMLTAGSLFSYSVERRETSNDRGDFLLLLSPFSLAAGESYTLSWELFPHDGNFFELLRQYPSFADVQAEQFTIFQGQQLHLTANDKKWDLYPDLLGYQIFLLPGGTWCRYQVSLPLQELALRRCRFIVERQQEHARGALEGSYLIYDNETGTRVYEENPNHNAGRERIGMGLLLAKFLQKHPDDQLHESLLDYTRFVLREHFDETTGEVFNELGRNNSRRRIYNNAWYASFFRELYRLECDVRWLNCMMGAFRDLYTHGGLQFYPLALEATDAIRALEEAGMTKEKEELLGYFIANAAFIRETGIDYPALEVNYEDNIVVPAGMLLAQMAELTGNDDYVQEARRHLALHEVFVGWQPDARQYGTAIHHWDDFWFGKRHLYGDTFPHYWTTAGALFDARMAKLTGQKDLETKARAGMRASLGCFEPDGSATCAIVTPYRVNGQPGNFRDPWANDQDWALYHCLVFDDEFGI